MYSKEIPASPKIPSRDRLTGHFHSAAVCSQKKVDHICDVYGEAESDSKHLQDDATTISDVCALFNPRIVKCLTLFDRLGQTATIVMQPNFESRAFKAQ